MNRNIEYIQQLQERNRLKKLMSEKTEAEMKQQELERGFSTHFRGAHAGKSDGATPIVKTVLKPIVRMNKVSPLGLARRMLPMDSSGRALVPGEQSEMGDATRLYYMNRTDSAADMDARPLDYPAGLLFAEEEYDEHDFEAEAPHEEMGQHQQDNQQGAAIDVDTFEANVSYSTYVSSTLKPETAPPALVDNIQGLSKEQKLALLQLLQ
ncbi:hypothetical protein EON65_57460, partial [archaeon]